MNLASDSIPFIDIPEPPPSLTLEQRFTSAATSEPPTKDQVNAVSAIQSATLMLAEVIDAKVADGRNKNLALTHLEDVLMRANRGVFATH